MYSNDPKPQHYWAGAKLLRKGLPLAILPLFLAALAAHTAGALVAQNNEGESALSIPANFSISYDLRGCKDNFAALWRYYVTLGLREGSQTFAKPQELRQGSVATGRFAELEAVPQWSRFAQSLGAAPQIFALLLWRDKGRDRAYTFAVQRKLDVYGKLYYPFVVYENFSFPWRLWYERRAELNCEENKLFADLPDNYHLDLTDPQAK